MILLIYYFLMDCIIDRFYLRSKHIERFGLSFCLYFFTTYISVMLSIYIMEFIIKISSLYGITDAYNDVIMNIWGPDITEVGGQVLLYFYIILCSLSLILFTILLYLGKRSLMNAGILTPIKLKKIYGKSTSSQFNGFYTLGIFWIGIVPVAVETIGEGKFSIPSMDLLVLTIIISIPFSYINLKEVLTEPNA